MSKYYYNKLRPLPHYCGKGLIIHMTIITIAAVKLLEKVAATKNSLIICNYH